jgi:hypothetical protein
MFLVSDNTGASDEPLLRTSPNSIKFGYRCFDRILLNGLIQPFQQPERVIGFFNAYREGERVTRKRLRDIAEQFGNWVKNRSEKWGAPILEAPEGRRDDFVDRYFRGAKTDDVVVILKAREAARIMIAIGSEERWHLQLAQRWIIQYNFYINDQRWGRMFVGGKRIPGLKLDHPRQLALMHALVRFAHVAAGNSFRTCELHAPTAEALGCTLSEYRLSSLRYDLSKLRAKGLVEKIPARAAIDCYRRATPSAWCSLNFLNVFMLP